MSLKITFRLCKAPVSQKFWLSLCSMIENLYTEHQTLFVFLKNQAEVNKMDTLLWTFKDISFLPHGTHESSQQYPITLSDQRPLQSSADFMLNLSDVIPDFHTQFKEIVEIIPNENDCIANARLRFKKYRELGYQLMTQKEE